MKSLSKGEEIKYEFPIATKYGKGVLIITNFSVSLNDNINGNILTLSYTEIVDVIPSSTGFTIGYVEIDSSRSYLELLCKNYNTITEYILKSSDISSPNIDESILPVIENECTVKSSKIPQNISNDKVWNDCYFDESRKYYITFSSYFMKLSALQTRPHQIEFKNQTDSEGIVAIASKVNFIHGFPAVKMGKGKQEMWVLLPTITSSMITNKMLEEKYSEPKILEFSEESSL